MRKIPILGRSVMVAVSLMVMITMMVSAAPTSQATTKQLSTNYSLVNLGSQDAAVTVAYYKDDGTSWVTDSGNSGFTIPKDFGQKSVAQYFDGTMSSGKGSAVISSSAALGGVVQIQARGQTPSSGAYSAITAPSNKYYVPLVQSRKVTASGTSNAQIVIQNTDTTNAQTVTVDFIPSKNLDGSMNGNTWSNPGISVKPGSTFYYDLSTETNLNSNWTGAAVVNAAAGKTIAVVATLFAGPNTLTTYNAFPQESIGKNWAIPQFVSRLASNKLSTSVNVQNLGASLGVGEMVMDCVAASGFTPATFSVSNTTVVDTNQGYAFNPVADLVNIPSNWSGACSITSTQDVVAVITLRRPGVSDDASAYEAFNKDQSKNPKVVFPLVSKRQDNGFATNAIVQNLGQGTATVKLTYTPAAGYAGAAASSPFYRTIIAGGNLSQNLRFGEVPEVPDKWNGTLVVESVAQDGNAVQPLVGYVQLTNINALPGDTSMAHDAFTLP